MCEIYKRHQKISKNMLMLLWLLLIFFIRLSLDNEMYNFLFGKQPTIILGFIFYPILLLTFLYSGILSKLFNNKVSHILGVVSFDMYVFQKPLISILLFLFKNNMSFISNDRFMYLFGIFMILTSFALHYWVEKPINRKMAKI